MELCPTWEAFSRSATKEFSITWKQINYNIRKSFLLLILILSSTYL
jgi:hypothetical protein